jgi:hypothetical protein
MTTAAAHHEQENTPEATLLVAFARRDKTWKLGCTTGPGQKPRARTVTARHPERVLAESAQAKRRLGLPESAAVVRCSAAGRAGFWRHRLVHGHGITNQVVDASALAVNRRRRRAQSDGLAVRQLLRMLLRYHHGARQGWQVGKGPSVEAEEHRHRHRALETLTQERASPMPRLQGLRRSQGLRVTRLTKWPAPLEAWRLWDGAPMPPGLRRRVRRV